jgi:hypothetical protein
MTSMNENIQLKGQIEAVIEYRDGRKEYRSTCNTVLRNGREALASSLANEIGDSFDFYISKMLFGDGGTNSGVPKFVNSARNGLFGVTRSTKSIISTIDPAIPSQVIFTSILGYDDANGYSLNEMALQMNNGDLYSMATFADLNKTSTMQITWNWRYSFV